METRTDTLVGNSKIFILKRSKYKLKFYWQRWNLPQNHLHSFTFGQRCNIRWNFFEQFIDTPLISQKVQSQNGYYRKSKQGQPLIRPRFEMCPFPLLPTYWKLAYYCFNSKYFFLLSKGRFHIGELYNSVKPLAI